MTLREKCPNTEFFSGPYFPVFGLNTEIYSLNLRILSEYEKIRTIKNSVFGHFSRSVSETYLKHIFNICLVTPGLYTSRYIQLMESANPPF